MNKLLFITLAFLTITAQSETLGDFSHQSLSGWEEKEFVDKTDYQFVSENDKLVLKAKSQQAASGLFKKIHIDLNKTPYLNWSWKIASQLNDLDEQSKPGDDYVARLYVVKEHDYFFWKTQALNYVWSSNQAKGTSWNNAFTSQAKMLAIQGKESKIQQWYIEKRNVKADFKRFFGEDIKSIDVIAIMSDTDNSKLSATAFYGDIFFTAQ